MSSPGQKMDRDADEEELIALLEADDLHRKFNLKDYFTAYPKQNAFFNFGRSHRERLLMAPNRVGKSEAGAFEMACHLTGRYPKWWTGRKFPYPVVAWACAVDGKQVRDVAQTKLCGTVGIVEDQGAGFIPRDLFYGKPSLGHGVAGVFDMIRVKHFTDDVEDGISILSFKSYEQGRASFQGSTLDIVWLDEEPPDDVHSECLTRIAASTLHPDGGMMYLTFTPLKAAGSVVKRYLNPESDISRANRVVVKMGMHEITHFTDKQKAEMLDGYPAHERISRYYGEPGQGEGAVFPVVHTRFTEKPVTFADIPLHWLKLWGIDFGIGHPFAAALIAWDRDMDCIHVLHCIRMKDALPLEHARAMRMISSHTPVAWPHDGVNRQMTDGRELQLHYKDQDLHMCAGRAAFPDGSISTEAGILEINERMTTERFKVSELCVEWFEEFRSYHREKGLIVKKDDDIMSATRVAVMAKHMGRPGPLGSGGRYKRVSNLQLNSDAAIKARNDFDVFA